MKKLWIMLLAVVLAVAMVIPMALPVSAYPSGLVALWHMDEGSGTTAYDSSGNSYDGTLEGGFGYALSFNGSSSYIEVDSSPSLQLSSQGTIEFWFKPGVGFNGYDAFILKGVATGTGGFTDLEYGVNRHNDGSIKGWISDHTGFDMIYTNTKTWTVGTWYHIAFTWSGTELNIYVNGLSDATPIPQTRNAYISSDPSTMGRIRGHWYNGILDEVRISNIARTSFNLESPYPVDANTVALWHFDEGSGQRVYDSARGNHGQLGSTDSSDINDPTWVVSDILVGPGALPQWTSGKFDGALSFVGNNGYVNCGDISNQDWSSLTTESWVWWDGETVRGYAGVYHKQYNNDVGRLLINGAGRVLVQNGNGNFFSDNPTGDVPTNQWCHIAYVYDQSVGKEYIYVDGVKKGEQARSGDIAQNTADLLIGYGWRASTFYVFSGVIDEVRIWNKALTAEEIALSATGTINWLPPVTNENFVLQDGTTLPLKFQIFNDSGLVTTMQPVSLEISGPEGFTRTYVLGDGVENLRWNADSSSYIVNLKTKDGSWPEGTYTAIASPICTDSITFELSPDRGTGRGNSGK